MAEPDIKGKQSGGSPTIQSIRSRYSSLLHRYPDVKRGSVITADVYLRRHGYICRSNNITPIELIDESRKDKMFILNFMMDLISHLEAEGKAGSYIQPNIKSWLSNFGISVEGRIKIRVADDTPSLKGKHTITKEEQSLLFFAASNLTRCAIELQSH